MRNTDLAALCQRLAETQQNLPVPLTVEERDGLREAAHVLREKSGSLRAPHLALDLELLKVIAEMEDYGAGVPSEPAALVWKWSQRLRAAAVQQSENSEADPRVDRVPKLGDGDLPRESNEPVSLDDSSRLYWFERAQDGDNDERSMWFQEHEDWLHEILKTAVRAAVPASPPTELECPDCSAKAGKPIRHVGPIAPVGKMHAREC